MSQQLDIFGQAKPLNRVAINQETVLALLAAHPEGCSGDEVGAAIHASRGKHRADETCAHCGPDSRPPLLALIKKKLVTRTGSGQFTLRNDDAAGGGPGELPEGF